MGVTRLFVIVFFTRTIYKRGCLLFAFLCVRKDRQRTDIHLTFSEPFKVFYRPVVTFFGVLVDNISIAQIYNIPLCYR